MSDYSASLLCAVNEARRFFGHDELVLQGNLIRAANAYAPELVTDQFFAHTSLDGETLADRLVAARFIPKSNRWLWAAGENLAAGEAEEGSPAAIVRAWLQSPGHRVNLLDDNFTMAGIGVARGWPAPNGDDPGNAMTVVLDFGYRHVRASAARRTVRR